MKWTLGWRFGNSTCKGKIVSLYGFYGEVTSLPKREIMALSSSLLSFHFRSSIFHFDFDPFFFILVYRFQLEGLFNPYFCALSTLLSVSIPSTTTPPAHGAVQYLILPSYPDPA